MVINKLWKTPRDTNFKNDFWLVYGCSGKFFGFPQALVDILVFVWITTLL
jgi:hypothetical protein